MRVCHTVSAGFDDPNLVSCAGLVPVMASNDQNLWMALGGVT